MSGFDAALFAVGVTIVGAGAGAVFGSVTRRRDDKDRRTGERIGVLEEREAYQRGYQSGLKDGRAEKG